MDSTDDERELIRRLLEENRQQADQLRQQAERIQQLEAGLQRLRELLEGKAGSQVAQKPVFQERDSLDRHAGRNVGRQRKRRGQQSTGRRPR